MEWIKRKEMKREEKFSDDLQASLYVDLNSTVHQSDHKKLFIPSSFYETPGLEIVDWRLLRSTSNSALKSKEGRRRQHGEDDGTSSSSLVTIEGATEKSEFDCLPIMFFVVWWRDLCEVGNLSHHSSSPYYNTIIVADIALSRLIDLLKNDKGYTIREDLTGEGMRGDVLTLVRLGVLSPLRVLYEVGG